MKYFFFAVFFLFIAAAICGLVAQLNGRQDLVHICGSVGIAAGGLVFLVGAAVNAISVGWIWTIEIGCVTRQHRPVAYWGALAIPIILGLGLLILGVYLIVIN